MKYSLLITLSICLSIFSSFAQEPTLTDTIQQIATPLAADNTPALLAASSEIIPNQGFTTQGLLRGLLGMVVLIAIAVHQLENCWNWTFPSTRNSRWGITGPLYPIGI